MLDEILKLGRFVNKVKLDTTPYDGMVWYGMVPVTIPAVKRGAMM